MSQLEINLNVEMAILLALDTMGADTTIQRARVLFASVMLDCE